MGCFSARELDIPVHYAQFFAYAVRHADSQARNQPTQDRHSPRSRGVGQHRRRRAREFRQTWTADDPGTPPSRSFDRRRAEHSKGRGLAV